MPCVNCNNNYAGKQLDFDNQVKLCLFRNPRSECKGYLSLIKGKMGSAGEDVGSYGFGVGVGGGPTLAATQQNQGVAALVVMLAVICFIFFYCCWGAPFCRALCRRHCCCKLDEDPETDSSSRYQTTNNSQSLVATPTIILLPHGRMLVVDGSIFSQFQAETTGLDLMEFGESMFRQERNPRHLSRFQLQNSQGSILEMDAETPSKDSLGSISFFPPPTYESIYGKEEGDMPPSYSDILLHRLANFTCEMELRRSKDELDDNSDNLSRTTRRYNNYATVTSFSSFSRDNNVSRNSSVISNPMDMMYLTEGSANMPRVGSSDAEGGSRRQSSEREFPAQLRELTSNEIIHEQRAAGDNNNQQLAVVVHPLEPSTSRRSMSSSNSRNSSNFEDVNFDALENIRESRV